MAKKQIQINTPDPEELAAEQHVEELMNPEYVKPAPEPAAEIPEVSENEDLVAAVEAQQAQAESTMPEQPESQQVEPEHVEPTTDEAPEELDIATLDAVDSPDTEKAVDEILRKDADAVLPETESEPVVMKQSHWARFKDRWSAWWLNPWSRYGTLVGVLALIFVIFAVQPIRAAVLNTFGVRSSMLVTVYDGASNFPLKNAVVTVGDVSTKTDELGEAKLTGIRLGEQTVEVSKVAFATYSKELTFGMRIIDIGEVTLKPVGAQLSYEFTDYLSGKPVEGVELTSGESTAVSDEDGRAVITLDVDAADDAKVTVKSAGYRTDELSIPADITATTQHKLVPGVHAIYVSKQSGKYDVYKAYVDGKDRQVLLAGTGLETQNIAVAPNSSGALVAVASARDNKRNSDGYVLTALNVIDVESGDMTTIDHVENVELLGWRGTTLVYQQVVAGTSAGNPSRMKIIAYDTKNGERYQLANGNSFGYSTQLIGSTLYYTAHTSSTTEDTVFARVDTDGTNKKTLQKASIWSLMRTDYDTMKLQTADAWYDYTFGQTAPIKGEASSSYVSRYYVDSPDGKVSAWVDARDTNGVLLVHNTEDAASKDTEITTERSLQAPLYWLNNKTVVYRVANSNETADYAVNIEGGDPVKIAEVSLTNIR